MVAQVNSTGLVSQVKATERLLQQDLKGLEESLTLVSSKLAVVEKTIVDNVLCLKEIINLHS